MTLAGLAGRVTGPAYLEGREGMLVLSRKKSQTICIGDDITITVAKISGNLVSIGIDAPRDVPVHRGEVKERIDRKQKP